MSPGQSGYVIIGGVSDPAEYGRCPRGTRADVATKEWGAVMLPRQSRATAVTCGYTGKRYRRTGCVRDAGVGIACLSPLFRTTLLQS